MIDATKMPPKLIPVYMPDEEARKYLIFKENYNMICLLIEKNVFSQKSAAITLNFDGQGSLQTIERRDYLFNRRFEHP